MGPAGVKARVFGWRFAAVESALPLCGPERLGLLAGISAQIQRIFICFYSNRSVDVQKQNPYPKGTRRYFLIPYTKN